MTKPPRSSRPRSAAEKRALKVPGRLWDLRATRTDSKAAQPKLPYVRRKVDEIGPLSPANIRRPLKGVIGLTERDMLDGLQVTTITRRDIGRLAMHVGSLNKAEEIIRETITGFEPSLDGYIGEAGIFGNTDPSKTRFSFVGYKLDEDSAEALQNDRGQIIDALGCEGILTRNFTPHISVINTRDYYIAVSALNALQDKGIAPGTVPVNIGVTEFS